MSHDGNFTVSRKFENIDFGTDYDVGKSAWVGKKDKKEQVIFYADGQFDYGPTVDRIRDIYPTPDSKTVEYKVSNREYGVNKALYDSKPQWLQLNDTHLFSAKKGVIW